MSKFDIEAALDRIDPTMRVGAVVVERIRSEIRAAVLAGREEAALLAEHVAAEPAASVPRAVALEVRKIIGKGIADMIRDLPDP